ncbi:hypothetical protein GFH30_00990 [Acinetobacter wanghuae]|uniref:Uncharacterized protein n=1 Tax=Acinetobacter wanghuae TaxID=2662362 RepID=A0A5Q0P0T2_9GAMM|nr:hypothetical protein [Acinetobacter wanghuae]MQW91963.1 hypothetical protein [Acinetobacter wanghuae]QGA10060.1 hypothetical protein GFH30_00990 [Acinetobacter wanghuae]
MNAKVKSSEQLIPFYSTKDIISAYTLASESSVQLRTLFNQIIKSISFVKAHAEEYRADSTVFTEMENLTILAVQLADTQIDRYNGLKNDKDASDEYDAGDLLDAYALAREGATWLDTLCFQLNSEMREVKEATQTKIHFSVFSTLERLIHIAEYLAESHSNTFNIECEKYEAEWEATKNG